MTRHLQKCTSILNSPLFFHHLVPFCSWPLLCHPVLSYALPFSSILKSHHHIFPIIKPAMFHYIQSIHFQICYSLFTESILISHLFTYIFFWLLTCSHSFCYAHFFLASILFCVMVSFPGLSYLDLSCPIQFYSILFLLLMLSYNDHILFLVLSYSILSYSCFSSVL